MVRGTALATAAAILVVVGPAHGAPSVTEFPTGAQTGAPLSEVVAGPDGALWGVATPNPGRVVRMTPAGQLTEYVADAPPFQKDKRPSGITVGPDGNLWLSEEGDAILKLTPAGQFTPYALGGGEGVPADIAPGPDGRLWFVEQGSSHGIGRIETDGTVLPDWTLPTAPVRRRPTSIVDGGDGAMWFTSLDASSLGRMTPAGALQEFPLAAGRQPNDIVIGPDGALWFTMAAGYIGRADHSALPPQITEFPLFPPGAAPHSITAGSDGALWFTLESGSGAVGRITTDGDVSTYTRGLTPAQAPQGIAAGPDGGIWFVTTVAPGKLARISVPPVAGAAAGTAASPTSATLSGMVRPNGQTTTYRFEYGPAGGPMRSTPEFGAGAGTGDVAVSVVVTGLAASTAHVARLVATSDAGTQTGADGTFTTAATPVAADETETTRTETSTPGEESPPQADPVPPRVEPEPTLGKAVVLRPERGTVLVKAPGQSKPVPLGSLSTLPVGSLIDASKGYVRLDAALTGGDTQSATFGAGKFVVRQPASGGGMTDIVLAGGSFKACRGTAAAAAGGPLAETAGKRGGKRRPVRRLWASDHRGKYRTHGRNSVATVRGTRWLTEDLCTGTRTQVIAGAVDVTPRRGGKRRRVRAGQSLLVPAR